MNQESHLLWQQALLRAEHQGLLNRIEEQSYHASGFLVPPMPTDDGALLRKALLSEDCVNDLVRPLREAGWTVTIDEPEAQGLYIEVEATAGSESKRIALLYTCASAPSIYRELAQRVDLILFRGVPYRLKGYIQGLSIAVGPVAGWLPPKPLNAQ